MFCNSPSIVPLVATHLVTRLEIEFVGMARLEVVEYDVQIGRQQTVRLLEMEKGLAEARGERVQSELCTTKERER